MSKRETVHNVVLQASGLTEQAGTGGAPEVVAGDTESQKKILQASFDRMVGQIRGKGLRGNVASNHGQAVPMGGKGQQFVPPKVGFQYAVLPLLIARA